MLRRIDFRGATHNLRGLLPRAELDVSVAVDVVQPLMERIQLEGAAAIKDATYKFDGVRTNRLRVPAAELQRAEQSLNSQVRDALKETIRRVRMVHTDQRRSEIVTQVAPGATVIERFIPVGRVGLYVPGGLAVYPSSVVMNVVPAQVAGVESIAVTSPPQKDTALPHPLVLAACSLLGVDEVYAVGGAQAIAMLAYGFTEEDESCLPVDIITGPGNLWVTAAKRLVRGVVGIDAEAGPTEIAIIADDNADPRHVAADLISQAEHDPLAASILITPNADLVDKTVEELTRQVAVAKHAERIQQALSGPQSAAVLVDDLSQAVAVANAYGAEHLEIQTGQPRELARQIRSAGAIFIGPHSPVSLGDYCAGSNHVLPTGGYAGHAGGLSVQTFLRGVHIVEYDEEALREVAGHVVTLAEAEDLPAHGAAVQARFLSDNVSG